jgi:hypothetical protein
MKSLRKIQIVAASSLVSLSLCGCSQKEETTNAPSATQEAAAQAMPQVVAPTPTNNPPALTPAPPLPPEAAMPTSTNELPTATPISVTI